MFDDRRSERMTARILDGKAIADNLLDNLAVRVSALLQAGRQRPGLAVVLVGNDAASALYVRNKRRACEHGGIQAFDSDLPADVSDSELFAPIARINADP